VRNNELVRDYLDRAAARLKAIDLLAAEGSHADVVRESQEVVELALKALLRAAGIEVPRIHDVSPLLVEHSERLPEAVRPHVAELARISRSLRRDRELAFYGSEDLTPSGFYTTEDGDEARRAAGFVVRVVRSACLPV
jgi:HEPN domain-containing protein